MEFNIDVHVYDDSEMVADLTKGIPNDRQPISIKFHMNGGWIGRKYKTASVMFNDRRISQFILDEDDRIRIPGEMVIEGNIKILLLASDDCKVWIDDDSHYNVSDEYDENVYTLYDETDLHAKLTDILHKKDSVITINGDGHFIFVDDVYGGYVDQIDVDDYYPSIPPVVKIASLYEKPIMIGSARHGAQTRKPDPRSREVYPFTRGHSRHERDWKDHCGEGQTGCHNDYCYQAAELGWIGFRHHRH